jgi:hypothetical protein
MKQIGNIIAIEVPETTTEISVRHGELRILAYKGPVKRHSLPPGNWTFICTNRDATEEQKTKLCYVKDFAGRGLFHVFGKYYPTEVTTQLHKSWTSLLNSLGADQGTKALLKKD